jgi:mannosidase alpha-like ER degradation enhancer 2
MRVLLLVALVLALCAAPAAAAYSKLGRGKRYDRAERLRLRGEVEALFYHGYNNYMEHAFPLDELKPLSCSGSNVFGGYALTLIDSLDMLALVGDDAEFFKQIDYIDKHIHFDAELRVSVFETTIRVIGGLLSAHVLALKLVEKYDGRYSYNGCLLRKSVIIADKLMPAFDTPTGIPYNEIHLKSGVAKALGHTTCPAGAGSLVLEFGLLSQLTGNCTYLRAAKNALTGVWKHRSAHNLVGTIIDIFSGAWLNNEANIGASIDSFYEYIFKAYVVFGEASYYDMWLDAYHAVQKYMYFSGWYLSSSTTSMGPIDNFDHRINALQAFWPGLQVLAGDVHNALDSYEKMFCVVRELVFMPEYVSLGQFLQKTAANHRHGAGYPLRPEFLESTYFLHRATGEDTFLQIAEIFLLQLQRTKVKCGFAAILDVFSMTHEDKMDSFMLAETLKYLYFIFSPDDDPRAPLAPGEHRLPYNLEKGFVVNTEAHPLPLSTELTALHGKCGDDPIDTMERFPLQERKFIRDDFTAVAKPLLERLPRTEAERRRICVPVDYMLDVAPFLQRIHNPQASCFKMPHLAVLRTKHNGDAAAAAAAALAAEVRLKDRGAKQSVELLFSVPTDKLDPWSQALDLLLLVPAAQAAHAKVRAVHGLVVMPAFITPASLYIPRFYTILRLKVDRVTDDGAVRDHTAGIFASNASFGRPVCQWTEGPAPVEKERRGILLAAASNLCPSLHKAAHEFRLEDVVSNRLITLPIFRNVTNRRVLFGLAVARGGCTFKEKALVAQALGAEFLLIGNSVKRQESMIMADADDVGGAVRLSALMVTFEQFELLKRRLNDGALPPYVEYGFTCVFEAVAQYRAIGVRLATGPWAGVALARQRLLDGDAPEPGTVLQRKALATRLLIPKPTAATATGRKPVGNLAAPNLRLLVRMTSAASRAADTPLGGAGGAAARSLGRMAYTGAEGRLVVQLRRDPEAAVAGAKFAQSLAGDHAIDLRGPHHYSRQFAAGDDRAKWRVVECVMYEFDENVDLNRHRRAYAAMEDDAHEWFADHGYELAGVVARFAGDDGARYGVEITVFNTAADMARLNDNRWEDTEYHSGHVLRAGLRQYRHAMRTERRVFDAMQYAVWDEFTVVTQAATEAAAAAEGAAAEPGLD